MEHPTDLGPRQFEDARHMAEMIVARTDGVRRYISNGTAFAIHSDEAAANHLRAVVEESQRLIDLLERGTKKKRK